MVGQQFHGALNAPQQSRVDESSTSILEDSATNSIASHHLIDQAAVPHYSLFTVHSFRRRPGEQRQVRVASKQGNRKQTFNVRSQSLPVKFLNGVELSSNDSNSATNQRLGTIQLRRSVSLPHRPERIGPRRSVAEVEEVHYPVPVQGRH